MRVIWMPAGGQLEMASSGPSKSCTATPMRGRTTLPSVILDEPTVGVDPLSRRELWEILQQLVADEGLTVLVSTAYMDEAELCSKVIVVEEGKVLYDNAPENLQEYMHPPNEEIFKKERTISDKVIIEVKNLVRKFGDFVAVNDVSFPS